MASVHSWLWLCIRCRTNMCFCAGSGRLAQNTPGAAGPSGAERDTGGGAGGEVTALCWAASPAKVGSLPDAEHCPVDSKQAPSALSDRLYVVHGLCWAAAPCRCPSLCLKTS